MLHKYYGYFVSTSRKYIPHTLVQLQSLYENMPKEAAIDVWVLMCEDDCGFKEFQQISDMLDKLQKNTSGTCNTISINRYDFDAYPVIQAMNHTEFNKRSRFYYINKFCKEKDYDAICIMDADMFIVSPQFFDLYDLVSGTDKMLVCNEKFKWDIGGKYFFPTKDESKLSVSIFNNKEKLLKMHCSVPLFFAPKKFPNLFETYLGYADKLREFKNGRECGIGDIYCWNLAVKGLYNDKVISFPMETMTQVHQTNMKFETRIRCENGYWVTEAGDQVFSIHGRVNEKGFVPGGVERFFRDGGIEKHVSKIKSSLELIQNKWYELYNKVVDSE